MRIEVWSDITCPWCWLGKHHLRVAIEQLDLRDQVELEFRAFELSPHLSGTMPLHAYLTERYGDARQVDAAHERLAQMGRAVGIEYRFDDAVVSNTFDAHRIHQFAKARGLGNEVVERLMRARQGEGADVSDHATLRRLAVEAGLDGTEVDEVLASDRYANEVRAEEQEASALGIRGVPFFVFDRRLALSGAQPVEVFVQALQQALHEPPPKQE